MRVSETLLLGNYASFNDDLVTIAPALFDANYYDIQGYLSKDELSNEDVQRIKGRISAIIALVGAYKKLEKYPIIFG